MIKECKIIMNNEDAAVCLYDDIKVQIPVNKVYDTVAYVKFENSVYSAVSLEDYEKENKKTTKSTTATA